MKLCRSQNILFRYGVEDRGTAPRVGSLIGEASETHLGIANGQEEGNQVGMGLNED
jgi:hypothetical protein